VKLPPCPAGLVFEVSLKLQARFFGQGGPREWSAPQLRQWGRLDAGRGCVGKHARAHTHTNTHAHAHVTHVRHWIPPRTDMQGRATTLSSAAGQGAHGGRQRWVGSALGPVRWRVAARTVQGQYMQRRRQVAAGPSATPRRGAHAGMTEVRCFKQPTCMQGIGVCAGHTVEKHTRAR